LASPHGVIETETRVTIKIVVHAAEEPDLSEIPGRKVVELTL
jgi:hypothetical protein